MWQTHRVSTHRKLIFASSMATLVLLLALMVSTAFAQEVPWEGNGANINPGYCNNNTQDSSVPLGMQSWLFILTNKDDAAGSYTLSYNFSDGTQGTTGGVVKGGGAVHFTVLTTADAKLLSATATGGNSNSQLTVSHCSVNRVQPLQVSKTANTTFTRTYQWAINKSVTPNVLNMFVNDSGLVTYMVSVNQTGYVDSDWAVSGSITIHNPNPIDATGVSVSDAISGFGGVGVNCPGNVVPANGNLVCTYSTSLPDATSRTNTATATADSPIPGGSGQAGVTVWRADN